MIFILYHKPLIHYGKISYFVTEVFFFRTILTRSFCCHYLICRTLFALLVSFLTCSCMHSCSRDPITLTFTLKYNIF